MSFDVTVIIKTYNHSQCIVRCLESVFTQVTDVRVEVVICDDASEDDTTATIDAYTSKVMTAFTLKYMYHPINLGHRGLLNGVTALNAASGMYVTILDGDDFWIDSNHIQSMFDALSANEDIVAVTSGHQKVRVGDGELIETCVGKEVDSFKSLADLTYYPLLGASMWANSVIASIPKELYPSLTDTMLWHFITKHGQCMGLPYVSLCYVMTGDGVHTSMSTIGQITSHVELYCELSRYESSEVVIRNREFWLSWAVEATCENDLDSVQHYSKMLVMHYKSAKPVKLRSLVKYVLISVCPHLLRAYKSLHT
jgi:glycosyltransferase involved in cell wall biosynthesis